MEMVRPKSLLEQANGQSLIDVQYMHANEKHSTRCGYCGGKKPDPGSSSWGIGVLRLSVQDYEIMMDRFWRRCGTYAYKYDLEQSCCQPYPIRLDVTEFQISKSQKKVLKKFYNFLENGRKTEESKENNNSDEDIEDVEAEEK